jgi:hypothetical protein
MNPVIVMAVWGRLRLVEINLQLLASQKCEVVVVTSLQQDFDFIRKLKHKNVHVVSHSNNPLGKKWQFGVDHARSLGANPVIILGSDDFLSSEFVEKAVEQARQNEFIFFTEWSIFDSKTSNCYHLRYKKVFPLGSGRIYSSSFLDRKSWQIFDTGKDIHLDDFAWDNLDQLDKVIMNPPGLKLLAVKGNWEQLNPLNSILSAHSITWEPVKNLDFGYDVKQTFKNL